MALVLAFVSGMVCSALAIGLGAWMYRASLSLRAVSTPPPVAPYQVYDRSDKAVAAMERRKRDGVSAAVPQGTNVVFDMQAPTT